MGALGLLFVGAALFVNQLAPIGVVDARAAAPINLFVGTLLVVVVLSLALPAGGDLTPVFTAAGFPLFGFGCLYVGIGNLTGQGATGVGWYCAWGGSSLAIALVTFVRDDVKLGTPVAAVDPAGRRCRRTVRRDRRPHLLRPSGVRRPPLTPR